MAGYILKLRDDPPTVTSSVARYALYTLSHQCVTMTVSPPGGPVQPVYIVSAARTPIGKFGGTLLVFTAADLGVIAAKAAIERAGVKPEQVEETIFGNARQAGGGPNVARQIGYRTGVPESAPAYTVNKACASGMKCIVLGYQEIGLGNADCILAG